MSKQIAVVKIESSELYQFHEVHQILPNKRFQAVSELKNKPTYYYEKIVDEGSDLEGEIRTLQSTYREEILLLEEELKQKVNNLINQYD